MPAYFRKLMRAGVKSLGLILLREGVFLALTAECQQRYHWEHGEPEYPKRTRIDPEALAASRGA